jgi:hypothetical protein
LLSTAVLSHIPALSAPVVQHLAASTASHVVTVETSRPTLAPAASGISRQLADTGKAVAGRPLILARGDLGGVANSIARSAVLVAGANNEPTQDWSSVPKLNQAEQACGTTSLAMIMDYLQGRNNVNPDDIDRAIHRTSLFGTAPSDLRNYARDHGLSAEMYNHSTIDELKGYLRQGYAVQVSINHLDGSKAPNLLKLDIKQHYVIVIGFEMRDGQEYVKIRDPIDPNNRDHRSDATYSMSLDDFKQKWGWPSDDGLRNFMIVYGKPGTGLPPSRLDGAEHSVAIAGVFTHDRDNWDRVIHPDDVGSWVHGAIAAPAGVIAPPTGVPPLVLAGAGWGLSYGGKKLHDLATKLPPVVSQVVTGAADFIDGTGKVLTQGSLGLSNAYNHVGAAAEDLAKGHVADAISHALQVGVDVINGGVGIATGAAQIVTAPLTGLGAAIQGASGHLPPVLGDVGKVLGRAVSAPGQIGQTLVQGVGNVAGDVGNALLHLGQGNFGGTLRSVGNAAVDTGKAIANVVSDAADAVGDAGKAVGHAATTVWDWIFGGGVRERPAVVDHRHH